MSHFKQFRGFLFKLNTACVLVVLSSCTSIYQLGYFEKEPYARPMEPPISDQVVIITSGIQDELRVTGDLIPDLEVTYFRSSMAYALNVLLSKSHTLYELAEGHELKGQGYELKIYRIYPRWIITSHVGKDGGYRGMGRVYSLSVKYESTLYHNGQEIGVIDGDFLCHETLGHSFSRPIPVFTNCIADFCEQFHSRLLEMLIGLKGLEK